MIANRLVALAATGALLLACTVTPSLDSAGPGNTAPPDFTGVWMAFASENPDGGGNTPKYSAEGISRLDAFAARYSAVPETGQWCLGLGMPSVMLSMVSYPIQIVQRPELMVMLAELEMQVRRVHLDGRAHSDDLLPSSAGHSTARWDGDTLVIDTALLSEWELRPWPRSGQARIVERVHLTRLADIEARPRGFIADMKPSNDDVLVFEMTLTDPDYYDGPQRRTIYFQRMDDTLTLEYLCTYEHWYDELEKHRIGD